MDNKKLVGFGFLILVIGLLIGGLLVSKNQFSPQNVRKVTVSGDDTITTAPDQARVFLGVKTEGLTADLARQKNSDLMVKVRAALTQQGLAEKDIETAYYYLNPKYNWENGRSDLIGYEAVQQLRVKVTDLEKIGKIIDETVQAGANQVDNIQFELSDQKRKQVSEELLAEAVKKAKEKAEILASNSQAHLGKVLEISEASYNYVPYYFNYAMEKAAAPAGAPTEINPQEVQVSVNVNIVFSLR